MSLGQDPSIAAKKRVLVVCTGNSARSQMVDPVAVRKEAVAEMNEIGADIRAGAARLDAFRRLRDRIHAIVWQPGVDVGVRTCRMSPMVIR